MRKIVCLILIIGVACAVVWGAGDVPVEDNLGVKSNRVVKDFDSVYEYDQTLGLFVVRNRNPQKKKSSGKAKPAAQKNFDRKYESINVEHNRVQGISDRKLKNIIRPYLGVVVGPQEIRNMHDQIIKVFANEGYIGARVYVDGDNLDDGVLNFLVKEGVFEDIIFVKANGKKYNVVSQALLKFTFYPFADDSLINIKDLDQGLEQMNRLASVDATLKILPGAKDGYSVVEVTNNSRKHFTVSLNADNSGVENSGIYKGNVSISADNILTLNENIYFNHSRNLTSEKNKENYGYYASVSIPFGYFTLTGSYFNSEYVMPAGTSFGDYTSDGSTNDKNIGLDVIIKRTQQHKVLLGTQVSLKETLNKFGGETIDVSTKKLTISSIFLTSTYNMKQSSLFTKLSYNQGLDMFDAIKNSDIEGSPKGQFDSFGLYSQFNSRLNFPLTQIPMSYTAALNAQYSGDILYGSEQISLGGQSSIRGFKEGSVSGDSGFYIRNDFETVLANIFKRAGIFGILKALSVKTFIDYGYVKHEAYSMDYQLAGTGAGINFRTKYINTHIIWGRSIYNESHLEDEGDIFYFGFEGKIYL